MKDFFISYSHSDQQWAEWIAWILEEAGYSTVIQAWDFRPGGNFVDEMQRAAVGTRRTIAVLSQSYLESTYTQPEWASAFARDPQGHERALVPIHIDECQPTGLLAQIIYVDIHNLSADDARVAILGAFSERAKPRSSPTFPGSATITSTTTPEAVPPEQRVSPNPVVFPGRGAGEANIQAQAIDVSATVRHELSVSERVDLNTTLNGIAAQHFNMLVFALNPPPGLIAPMPAPQADRANNLLEWADSTGGCGLSVVLDTVTHILGHLPPHTGGGRATTVIAPQHNAILGASGPVVISLHGIRTRGAWQKESLGRALNENGFVHVALDFGFFNAIQLLIPSLRRAKVDWFRDKYTENRRDGAPPPSVIAHSFGTYLVARLMQIYDNVDFDFGRIILCGSIVDRWYPWSAMFKANRCEAVLNDYGQMDVWARIAKFFINDAGDSGVQGFFDDVDGRVVQNRHPEFRHSDYFFEANYRRNWIPFLLGVQPKGLTAADRPPINWHYQVTRAAGVLIVVALLLLVWWQWAPAKPEFDNITLVQIAEAHEARDFPNVLTAFRAAHLGRQVEWDATIIERVPNGYIIAPIPNNLAHFKVLAKYDPNHPMEPVSNHEKVKVKGIIDDITASDIGLRDLQLVKRLD